MSFLLMSLFFLANLQNVFAANYSRKLSSLKHRLVIVAKPDEQKGSPGSSTHNTASIKDFLYWVLAFESPHEVKVLARQTLGDENAPQGHLRLILVNNTSSPFSTASTMARDMHAFSIQCELCCRYTC